MAPPGPRRSAQGGARRASRAATTRIDDDALLVRSIAFGEADLVATFFTRTRGVVATVARGARRASRRFAALEPVHLLRVAFDERPDAELAALREASITSTRPALAASLDALDAAGRCLRWVRRGLPPRTPEPEVWRELNDALDTLDRDAAAHGSAAPSVQAANFGLRLLADLGWGLELARCASCGKPCDPAASAYVDAARGGLVCRACGGGGLGQDPRLAGASTGPRAILLRGDRRAKLLAAAAGDDRAIADASDADVASALVDAALDAHTR